MYIATRGNLYYSVRKTRGKSDSLYTCILCTCKYYTKFWDVTIIHSHGDLIRSALYDIHVYINNTNNELFIYMSASVYVKESRING